MTTIDPNTIITGIASHIYDALASGASQALQRQFAKVKWQIKPELEIYTKAILSRTSKVKTIVHPDEAVHIDDIYVPLSYTISGDDATDTSIFSAFESGLRVLVVGTAGGGKSMLIKKMCTKLLSENNRRIPIFYELRYLNGLTDKSLTNALYESVRIHAPSLPRDTFDYALRSGKFGLILDGFDEVDHDHRKRCGREIEMLSENFPSLALAVTSRPEDDLPGLSAFSVYHASSMSKDQTIQLVSKIEYDEEKKSSFLEKVESDLFLRSILILCRSHSWCR